MRNIPTITKNLLIINILAFLAMYVLKGAMGVDLNNLLGLHFFMASDFQVYQLVTYMFMHANFEHILFNMFALWMFGCVVENVWGPKKFLFYYIFCGVGAGMRNPEGGFVWSSSLLSLVVFSLKASSIYSLASMITSIFRRLRNKTNVLASIGGSS